uniref:RING-type domain-containing protein n=1 Tax=Globodera rostochiensis TaxID=31243 RepID=A0A914HKP0_GLORO
MRKTISMPTISKAPIDRVFQVELGPEAKLAQMLTGRRGCCNVCRCATQYCDVISRVQTKLGTRFCQRPNYTQPISVELNHFYGHEIFGLTVNLFRLKTYAINDKEKRELGNCPSCFNSFMEKQKISKFHEKHFIHSSCIQNWILSHGEFCPKCIVEVVATKVIKLEPCFTETSKEIKQLAYELKLNKKEIFTKFSTKNIENAKQDVNQILGDPLNDIEKAQKLMELLVDVTEKPEFLAQKTLEELRIVREKSESEKNY